MKVKYVIVAFVCFISTCISVFSHEGSNIIDVFSKQEKQLIENKLERFLNKVDSSNQDQQFIVYEQIQNKISSIQWKYEVGSKGFVLLDFIIHIVEHKADNIEKLSNHQILKHVLYGIEYEVEDIKEKEEWIITVPKPIEEKPLQEYSYSQELNEYEKTILAGEKQWVVSYRVRANLEPIDVETVEFSLNQDIINIGMKAYLYLNGNFIWEASSPDIKNSKITFDGLDNLIIPVETAYLQLELLPESIWQNFLWTVKSDLVATGVKLLNGKGQITGDNIATSSYDEDSKAFNIVPVKLSLSVESEFEKNKSFAGLKIIPHRGKNNDDGADFNAYISEIDVMISSLKVSWEISVFNSQGVLIWNTTVNSSGKTTIILTPDVISSRWEVYRLETSIEWNFYLPQDGVRYSAGSHSIETKNGKELYLGQR